MKTFGKWAGLFGLLVLIVLAIALLFLDTWLRLAAIKGLEDATGAEVNIARVEHSYDPFRVLLFDVQLTDPRRPARNKLEAAAVDAYVQVKPLLAQKVIIDTLTIDGVQFNTLRSQPGQVYRQPPPSPTIAGVTLPEMPEVPDIDELVARSPLETTRAIEALNETYHEHQEQLKQRYQALPDKAKLKHYEQQLKSLTEQEFESPAQLLEAKQTFDAIKQQLRQEKQQLQAFNRAALQAKEQLSPRLAALKQAPETDYRRLKGLIAGESAAIEEVTELVFGQQARQWSHYLLVAFDTLAPALKNAGGNTSVDDHYRGQWLGEEIARMPDFWVKQAVLTLVVKGHSLSSQWWNITHQHKRIDKPTEYQASISQTPLFSQLQLQGSLLLQGANVNASQTWQLTGVSLPDVPLLRSDKLTTSLLEGLLSTSGEVTVEQNNLQGAAAIELTQLKLKATGTNKLTTVIANTLQDINKLRIDTDVGGSIGDPTFQLRSDLDQQIAGNLLTHLGADQQEKLRKLERRLNEKAANALKLPQNEYQQWLKWQDIAQGDLSSIETLLNTKLESLVDQQKDKLKDKLLDKLFGTQAPEKDNNNQGN